ncbi:SPOR domain-containing protein [Xanthobacter sp. AM11]|uniref:SPOR domain-containing protein n=1 Tax=Xanthobacter sp. AM11 TaxID=3380643 RepID=UPI0039BEF60E
MGDESRFRYRRDDGAAEGAARQRSGTSPATGGDRDGDPLVELARLIGEQDPFDDFSALEPEPAPRPDPRRPAAAPRYAAPAAPALRQIEPRQIDPRGADPRLADPRFADPRAADPRAADPRVAARAPVRPAPAPAPSEYYDDEEEDDAAPAASAPAAPVSWQAPSRTAAARAPEPVRQPAVPARFTPPPVPAPTGYGAARGRAAAPAVPAAVSQPDATVRLGYGSLARQQAAARPSPVAPPRAPAEDDYEDDDTYAQPRTAPGRAAPDYDRRAQDERSYDPRGRQDPRYAADDAYDDGAADDRAYDDRTYDDRAYDDRAPRAAPARSTGSRPQDARGYAADEDEAAYAYSAARRDDDYDDYDDSYDPEYGEDGYMPPHGEEVYDQEPRKRKGRMALLLGISVLGLLVAGVAGVFAYNMAVGKPGLLTGSSTPPVIKADSTPAKIASPAPSPAADSQQKLIYDRVGATSAANERVVPREEQPVDVTSAVSRTAAYAPADPTAAPASVAAPAGAAGATEPKKVRTLSVRADGTVASGGTGVSAYAASPSAAPSLADPAAAIQLPPAAPVQTAAATPAPAATGSYVVQVASQRSEADALGSWKVLQQRYPNILGSYKANVKRADLGDKGIYYRAQVGPFATRDQANELCQSLRAQGGDCVITKN